MSDVTCTFSFSYSNKVHAYLWMCPPGNPTESNCPGTVMQQLRWMLFSVASYEFIVRIIDFFILFILFIWFLPASLESFLYYIWFS